MKRRAFLQAFGGAIASVAIGARMARGLPEVLADGFEYKVVTLGYTIVSDEVDEGLYGDISEKYAKALARSMIQTKEVVGANVLSNAFTG